jgi:putative endonuclease
MADPPAAGRRGTEARVEDIVYVLQSDLDGGFYVGLTADVDRRLEQHNQGWQRSTKGRRPWKLRLTEQCGNRAEARAREKYWKSGQGRERLRVLPG